MVIDTAVLGPMEVAADSIYDMPDGLLGFDGVNRYALITKQDDDVTLMWLQAVDASAPCFVVFNPFEIVEGYEPQVEKTDLKALNCAQEDLLFLVIAVVPEDITKTTVNLKSPVVINPRERIARQIILANKEYPIQFSLAEEA